MEGRAGRTAPSSLFSQVGGPGSKWEAVGMFSGDGEYVDFLHPVLLEGPVEVSSGEGLRAELILLPLGKRAWLCEGRAPP